MNIETVNPAETLGAGIVARSDLVEAMDVQGR